ncbi:MAG: PGF-pre-PGF domain-containing protein [Halobacteria archaeon]
MQPQGALLLLLLLLGTPAAAQEVAQSLPLSAPVPLACFIEIGSPNATPANATRCSTVEFAFPLNNSQGNVPYTAFPFVRVFDSGGNFLQNVTGTSLNVSKAGSASVSLTWNAWTNPNGTYTASAYANATAAASCSPAGPRSVSFSISGSSCPPPPANVTEEEKVTLPPAGAGQTVNATVSNTSVGKIAITAAQSIFDSIIVEIREFTSQPSGTLGAPPGHSFAYFSVDFPPGFNQGAVANVTLTVKVLRTAVVAAGIDASTLRVYRYVSNIWDPLPTVMDSQDANFFYLKAVSPGLSFFSISGTQPGAPPPPAPGAAAAGGGAAAAPSVPAIPPPEEFFLRFRSSAVLIETRPGADVTTPILVENPGSVPLTLSVRAEGPSWNFRSEPPLLRLDPGARAPLALSFRVPEDAPPGDHRVLVRFRGDVAETTFLFVRVRPFDPGRAGVFREVSLDKDAGVTRISLQVRNGANPVPRLEVVEAVPKSLAPNASSIRSTTPFQVLEDDPVIRFVLRDVQPGETRTVRYEVDRILSEYGPYVYFPVRQVNLFATVTPLRLDVRPPVVPPLTPGLPAQVRLAVENREAFPVEVTARVELPPGWRVEPETLADLLSPGTGGLSFTLVPPADATGPALLTFRVEAQGQELRVQAVVEVQGSPWTLVAALAAAGGAGLLLVQRQVAVSRRRARERAVRLIEFRQRMRRT